METRKDDASVTVGELIPFFDRVNDLLGLCRAYQESLRVFLRDERMYERVASWLLLQFPTPIVTDQIRENLRSFWPSIVTVPGGKATMDNPP